jgi:hypothetical protein
MARTESDCAFLDHYCHFSADWIGDIEVEITHTVNTFLIFALYYEVQRYVYSVFL